MRFRNGRDLFIGELDSEIVEAYETYIIKTLGLKKKKHIFILYGHFTSHL